MSLAEQKRRLRISLRAARLGIGHENTSAFKALTDHFRENVSLEPGAVVAGYRAFRGEMDPALLIEALRQARHPIALPVVTQRGQPLIFRLHGADDPLAANAMGILEPLPSAPVVEPDVFLVPLLAFDRAYNRLGYGAGFYDRTLTDLRARKPLLAVGVAFAAQEVAAVPVGPYDAKLDKIVTELNVF
ncbi:MAG: 5-formyltetrahydrofolate cyclo-ligase [Alphaproteobacteria bacterium]|nr:5-formyltetrahydrofolate cyclo-ligase [Alphaproteobacteria bacterium]